MRQPGTYRFTWSGRTPEGTSEPEGRWRWIVTATDDQGQQSTVTRSFWLNNTLGYLSVNPARVVVRRRGGKLWVGFRLAHPARVTLAIKTARGVVVKTIRRSLRAGPAAIRWDGRYGNGIRAFSGPYLASVYAANSYGPAQLQRRFFVRRR